MAGGKSSYRCIAHSPTRNGRPSVYTDLMDIQTCIHRRREDQERLEQGDSFMLEQAEAKGGRSVVEGKRHNIDDAEVRSVANRRCRDSDVFCRCATWSKKKDPKARKG